MHRARNAGFTLIETLIALAIVGIALAAAIRASAANADAVNELRTRTAAGWVANNVIQQLLAERRFPDFSSTEGKATQGQVEFIWRQEVSASPNYSFRRVEVKVFLPDAPDHAVAKLVSYVARQQ